MNYTFRNNLWKDEATNSIIPTNSRPFNNKDSNLNNISRTAFKANPIKHWRKQLYPYYKTKSSKHVSIDMIDAPTSVVYIGDDVVDCSTTNSQLLKENITILNQCNGIKISSQEETKCVGGTNNIKRSGNTKLKNNYYRNHSKYLQARCKTYDKNSTLGTKIDDNTYNTSSTCSNLNNDCKVQITYKPSNKVFLEQGATSASTNILRKKNIEITKNSKSLIDEYGIGIGKNSIYDTNTGYELRFKKGTNNTNCRRKLRKNIC